MGASISNKWWPAYYSVVSPSRKLCDDIIKDNDEFLITVHIRTLNDCKIDMLLNYMQNTGPCISYIHKKTMYLIYSNKYKQYRLRSNISGELISALSSEVTINCMKHNICEPYTLEVDIVLQPYDTSLRAIISTINENNYNGVMYGIDNLSYEKIKEQFGIIN
jgi:hypothetical protein